jgi:membrane associated rhomboid family serine protease
MFLPLHDGVPLQYLKTPLATRLLLALCVIDYLLMFYGPIGEDWVVAGFGLIPAVLFGTEALPEGLPFVPEELTLVTSIFLHGSFLHLAGNMLFLWVFGDNVEDAMGHLRFVAFFVLCGVLAGLTHALIDPESTRPLIGASGAVSGVVAAYLILYPRVRVWGLFLKGIPLRVPAVWAIGFWFLLQLVAALLALDDGVGWFAHLGGFMAGAVLTPVMRRRYDPVLARVEAHAVRQEILRPGPGS